MGAMKKYPVFFVSLLVVIVATCTNALSAEPSESSLARLQGGWTLHYFSLATKTEVTTPITAEANGDAVTFFKVGNPASDWYLRVTISPQDKKVKWDRKWPENSDNCFPATRGIQPVEGHISEDSKAIQFSEPLYVSGSCRALEVKEIWTLTREENPADSATYECKSDLGAQISGELTAEVAQENPDMAAAMETLTGHYVYSFDFRNKRVTFRMLDNKGNDYGVLGIGQAVKYTTAIKVDGDQVSWTDVISDSPEGIMKADYLFNSKIGKMHVVTAIKPASGEAQTLDEDHSCIPYLLKNSGAK
jgi:hypothetical protein